jgi:hypothetical protein
LSKYLSKKHIAYIVLAGISAGLAAASKYNSFLITTPLILGILFFGNRRIRDFVLLIAATGFGFFLGCPYILLSLNEVLMHAGKEVIHYQTGHPGAEGTSGLSQMQFYLQSFKDWSADVFHFKSAWYLPVTGVLINFYQNIGKFLIVFSFPIVYLIYMSQQRVNFLRNMTCMTPFISLAAAIALYYVYKLLLSLSKFIGKNKLARFYIYKDVFFIVYFLLLLLSFRPVGKLENAYRFMISYRETRTKAVEYVRDNFPDAKIGISKELRLHRYDLDKIRNRHVLNTEEVSLSSLYRRKFDYIISSDKYAYFFPENKKKNIDEINLLKSKFPEKSIVKSFGHKDVMLDIFSVEPKVNIYKVDESFMQPKEK